MPTTQAPISRAQTLSGAAILLVLVAVALGILYKQAHYDPLSWGRPTPPPGAAGPAGGPLDLAGLQVPGLTPLGPPENFNAQTLSDKINGKAELYLSAGFKALATRRYHLPGDPQAWFEAFVFDQGQDQGAFSAFSTQRRNQGRALDLGAVAHLSGTSLFILRGPYYVEVIDSGDAPALTEAMQAWAKAWLALTPASAPQAGQSELDLFPPEGLERASLSLLAANVFGCDKLDQVYAGSYQLNGQEATGFISRRADAAQAQALASAYAEFLLGAGGREEPGQDLPQGGRLFGIMGTYELVFSQGTYLAGVHGAEDRQTALDLGQRIFERLPGGQP
ncbi:MAG: hypothetical protein HY794_15510 [Desulfarculus sp.]|nr:hypothetical protein [Desulfarculus sp.]